MVSDVPGTTRDAVDVPVDLNTGDGVLPVTLIDTAGLRRRRREKTAVEVFGIMRAENAVRRSDIVLLVTDATTPGTAQDRRIASLVANADKPCLIVANKWDLAGKETKRRELLPLLANKIPFLDYAPVICTCAVSGYGFNELPSHLVNLHEQMQTHIPTAVLNQFLRDLTTRMPPASAAGKQLKLYYATMVTNPPARFLLFVNHPSRMADNYRRFLVNSLRNAFFPHCGLPVRVDVRSRRQADRPDGGRSIPRRRAAATAAKKTDRHPRRAKKRRK